MLNTKIKQVRSKRNDGSSGSRGRFDFVGPYAQNLKKPKLYEARGTQKIALKNHLASMNRQGMNVKHDGAPFNSDVFPRKKSSLGGVQDMQQHNNVSLDSQIDDRDEKHSGRFNNSDGNNFSGNYVIQHR